MRADFQVYIPGASWLHRLDPRVKLVFVLLASVLSFLWPTLWMQATLIGLSLLLLASAGVPGRRVARVTRNIVVMASVVFVLSSLFGGGNSAILFSLGPLNVRLGGVTQGALLALRLVALALIFAVWLLTTDQTDLVRGFVALGIPYNWGLTLALAFRYFPAYAGLYGRIREAQQARGLDLEGAGLRRRLQSYQPVLIALIISALRNSEVLGWALESRGLGATGLHRTVFRPLHMARRDWVILTMLGVMLALAIALRVL